MRQGFHAFCPVRYAALGLSLAGVLLAALSLGSLGLRGAGWRFWSCTTCASGPPVQADGVADSSNAALSASV